ncbi:restriction endonuclease subunit S [Streptococcus thermophilus]|nr:restriction endonuclease subunit S [Streptococcus thermophilus]MCE2185664.1 restriction endonuclease subunit S [Streptococcus thermophilus]MCE2193786.1 restriction endonuclease subunit S [Streptococcus thermophilus]MCE2209577.1 restriction endonuclease subunit S [Streptococcus thermophilus]MCE2279245.1 restriction endonuclease subunit S [Streptococcus thermophilus]
MSEWKFLTLKEAELEFIDGDRGVNYPKKSELLPEGDCVFLNTGNVRQNSFDFSNLDFITKEKDNLLRNGKLQRDDIVLTTRGTVGNVALYSQEVPFSNIRINSGMVIIRVNKNFWHPYFIYLFFQSHLFKKQISRLISGSAQPQLPISILETVNIPQLTLDEQKEIIFNIKSIDQKIQINNQINQELEAMAKTLYDYWFVQFDFPDQNGNPYKSSGGKMVYNPELKREIPEGWGVDSLWNIANFYNGLAMQKYRPDTNEDDYLPVIKIREMMNGFSKDTERARLDIPSEAVVDRGDILFSWSATLEVIIWGKEKGALNQHIFKVTSDTYPKSFIYFELKSYLKVFKAIAELRKTTMGHITQDHLKQAKIVVPPIELISKLDAKLQPIMLKQQILENQNQELTQLRDWLLPMLMNGQVKVE